MLAVELDQHPEPRRSLDQRADLAGTPGTDDRVGFPVSRHGPISDLGGPLGDVHHAGDLAGADGSTLRPPPGATRPQARSEFFAQLALGLDIDRLIDRLV